MAHMDSAPAMGDYVPLRPSGGPDMELLDEEEFPGGDPLASGWRSTPHHPGATNGWSSLWRSLWPHNATGPHSRGWRRPELSVLEVLLAVITALLAAAVLLLSSDVRVSKALAAAQLRHWETTSAPGASPPPIHPPPPSPPGSSATAPVSAWTAHLQAAGYVPFVSSFVTLWWHSAQSDLLLQFPRSAHHRLILLNAEVSAADADTYLLHQPLGEAFWHVAPAPDGVSLDVVIPPLERQRVAVNSTLAPAAAGGGTYAGPAFTLRRYNGGTALGVSSALDAQSGERSAFYLANDFLLNRFALVGVLGELDTGSLDAARVSHVTAHPRNLEMDIQGGANGTHVAVHLSLTLAPDVPMAPRLADDRAGFFSSCFVQLGSDPTSSPANGDLPRSAQDRRACLAHRWRLERAATSPQNCGSPASPKCVPKTPITYHLDPSIPDKWAACFAHGVTAWDAAFQAAGWAAGTIRALRPSDPAWPSDYSSQDIRFSSITFAPSLSSVYAVGPSTVDPRSGEVIAADIMFAHAWVAWFLGEWHSLLADEGTTGGPLNASTSSGDYHRVYREPRPSAQCFHHHGPHQHGGSGAGALLKAHGLPPPALTAASRVVPFASVPAQSAEAFVCEGLADVTAHEVGHTLGLRHNFAGSAAYSASQLADAGFVASHGVTASIMDYLPPLMWANRSVQSYYFGPVVGEYDKWAISVGYAPSPSEEAAWQQQRRGAAAPSDDGGNLEPASPEAVPPEVAALLSRANETVLAFCTDDADSSWSGNDPSCSTYDLTSDPVAYFRDRNALIGAVKSELVARLVAPTGEWSDAYDLLHTLLHTGSISVATGGQYAAKQVGGAAVRSAHFGQVAAPVTPVEVATQRDALQFIVDLLVGDALYPDPATSAAMTRNAAVWRGKVTVQKDSLGRLPADILGDARAAKASILASLLAPSRADGVVRNAWMRAGSPHGSRDALTLTEVVDTLQRGIWGDALWAALTQGGESMVFIDACPSVSRTGWAEAIASLGQHDTERRAVQRMWVDALRKAAAPGTACDLCAEATASLAELLAGLRCALTFVGTQGDRGVRAHLLALTSA
jgi:hypothetical protein